MSRSRFLAALAAVVMATSALLIPGTAQADVTDASVAIDFDNQSADRIATITVRAKSESGITDVGATLEYMVNAELPFEWEEFATLSFTLVDGTVNDGTWQAQYQLDVESHPGPIEADVRVKSADGATWSTRAGGAFDNCYRASITDLSTTPEVVDFDHREVTVSGRVLVHKTRDSEPEPAANVTVATGRGWDAPTTRTAADGTFTYTQAYDGPYSLWPQVSVITNKWLCSAREYAPEPEVTKQPTDVLAVLPAPDEVTVGNTVRVSGGVERQTGGRSVVAVDVPVQAYVDGQLQTPDPVRTDENGHYELEFPAETSGTVTVRTEGGTFLEPGEAVAGELTVRPRTEIVDFTVPAEPVAYGFFIEMTGRVLDGGQPVVNGKLVLEFSQDGKSGWTYRQTDQTKEDGSFVFHRDPVETGYWRILHLGEMNDVRSVSEAEYLDVRYKTDLRNFSAEPASAGGAVTVQGELVRYTGEWEPADLPVYVYFMPDGASEWEYKGTTTTGGDGAFSAEFATSQDGYWTAAFWGDDDHLASDAPIAHADVVDLYETKFSDFAVSPETVEPGGSVTVSGTLNRSADGGTPEAAADKPVYVYFLPAGSSEWQQVATVRTGADGSFEKAVTADQDGHWTAWFFGDDQHAQVNSGSKYVDVQ